MTDFFFNVNFFRVILFANNTQNILILFKLEPLRDKKKAHVKKSFDFFLLYLHNRFFLVLEVLYKRSRLTVLFHDKFTLCTSNYFRKEKQIYFLQTVFIWSSFLWKSEEDSHRPKYTTSVFLCLKRNDSQTFKKSNCKKHFLQCVFYWNNSLRYFSFHVIAGKHGFFFKVSRYPESLFNRHVLAFFETSDLKEVCILFIISRITVQY